VKNGAYSIAHMVQQDMGFADFSSIIVIKSQPSDFACATG